MSQGRVTNKQIDDYKIFLREKYRPPSRGGNSRALHSHVLYIGGERYSFLAVGSQQWVYKSDTVSFEFEIRGGYKNVMKDTLITVDSSGNRVVRGNRGYKRQLRTADTRLPASRRERRDGG
jgi:hypothetical protein